MAYQLQRRTLRAAHLIGVAFATLIYASSGNAVASPGCASLQGSRVFVGGKWQGLKGNELSHGAFAAGDVISGTTSGDALLCVFGNHDAPNGAPVYKNCISKFTYTVPKNTTAVFYISIRCPSCDVNPASASWICTNAPR